MHLHLHTPTWLHCTTPTPLGTMRLARTAQGLCGAWFEGQRHAPAASAFLATHHAPTDPLLQHTAQQLQGYFEGTRTAFDLPLDMGAGSAFAQQVWQALLALPCGHTASYGALAAQLGRPTAARAVGAAVGRNPVSIIVPCHRVLGSTGQLTGYAGGLERKKALLRREGHAALF